MFLLSVDELDIDNINGKPEIRTVNKQVADCHALTACIAVRFFLLIYSLFSVFNCELRSAFLIRASAVSVVYK